ncbi:hypothetical protein BDZ45DRAFT_793870 [Acephala macrosclerotiorum]|nr:hypothetical protein BDZ45DRAFT_793870 [Acephala macrosclerotiorum]
MSSLSQCPPSTPIRAPIQNSASADDGAERTILAAPYSNLVCIVASQCRIPSSIFRSSSPITTSLATQSFRPRIIGGLIVDFGATSVELAIELLLLDVVVFRVVLVPVQTEDVEATIELEVTEVKVDAFGVATEEDEVGGTQGVVVCFGSVFVLVAGTSWLCVAEVARVLAGGVCGDFGVAIEEEEEDVALVVGTGVFGETSEERDDTIELMMLVTGLGLVITDEVLLGRIVEDEDVEGFGLVTTEDVLVGITLEDDEGFGVACVELLLGSAVGLEETLGVVTTEEDEELGACVELLLGLGLVPTEEVLLGRTVEVEETLGIVTSDEEDEEVGLSVVTGNEGLLGPVDDDVGSWVVVKLETGAVEEVVGFPVKTLLVEVR